MRFSSEFGYDYDHGRQLDELFGNPDFIGILGAIIGFVLIFAALACAISLTLYILRSIGLYKLADNRGMGGAGLAWIPWVGFYRIGSIADDIAARSGEKTYYRYILLVGGISGSLSSVLQNWILYPIISGFFSAARSFGRPFPFDRGDAGFGYPLFSGLGMIISMLAVVVFVITLIALNKIYKTYRPMSSTSWTVLSAIFPFMQSIFLFIIRNSAPISEWNMPGYYPSQEQCWQAPPPYPPYNRQQAANTGHYPAPYGTEPPLQQYISNPAEPGPQPPVAPDPPGPWEIEDSAPRQSSDAPQEKDRD